MDKKDKKKDIGKIRIKKEVISAIVSNCIKEIEYIRVGSDGIKDELKKVFSRKHFHKGIKVEIKNNRVKIYINAIVNYRQPIQTIAGELQSKIKIEVEQMSGLIVDKVDIIIRDLGNNK